MKKVKTGETVKKSLARKYWDGDLPKKKAKPLTTKQMERLFAKCRRSGT